ncbi:hypothetical protein HFN97_20715 [Rhizobium laguerreae]|uniref:hypothetical protein n=1 Tax=Rhizobium laguerreae TaxID=1076926 RepID=UPI001C9237FE|nr:hypothetical protein [Rhizobium laguerreae]MBY3251216.1 hypothetical protein [Rhizobium laguerreae]MBY3360221.1 hypothetical protein [Rhizobium laguerreae]
MSDGPHKSLPLRPKYKRLAEWAYKPAFPVEQVCEAAEAAILHDARTELAPVVARIVRIADGEDLLTRLPGFVQEQLRALRDESSLSPLAASAVECIVMACQQGLQGRDAVQEGVDTALRERLAANARTTEEHYLVEAGRRASLNMRERMNKTMNAMDANGSFSRIARSVIGDKTAAVSRAPVVRDSLEEGVPF